MARLLHKNQTRHGFHGSDVYKLWCGIVKRCENESSSNFEYYGGRGINLCEEWRNSPKSFCEWALSNGYKKGLEIDRKNVNKGYNPDNCHFVTHFQNCEHGKRRVFKSNTTGFRCVSRSRSGSFEVYVTVNKKQKYIGCRKTIEEAVKLRDEFKNIQDNPELLKQ